MMGMTSVPCAHVAAVNLSVEIMAESTKFPHFLQLTTMTTEIELDDLQNGTPKTRTRSAVDSPAEITIDETDQTITWWAYGSTALLLCLAIPMILFPRLLLFASETSADRRNTLTNLEAFLSLNGGIILVALATALLFNASTTSNILDDYIHNKRSRYHLNQNYKQHKNLHLGTHYCYL
ncbi:hypothetical protein C8Q75DRAFT_29568 [Abortiporus biennis]|nr:hypothetical protein C8Q75DRAFT_29568 [Abortiporus biennis]